MSATMLKPGDCAVVISNSGRSRDLLDVADIARRKGATLIVITASASPLAQMTQAHSQILLAADHPEDFDRYSPMVSRMLHLMIIDILTTGSRAAHGPGLAADAAGDQAQPAVQALHRARVTRARAGLRADVPDGMPGSSRRGRERALQEPASGSSADSRFSSASTP